LVLATLVRGEEIGGYICILEVHCHDRTIYPSADTPGGNHGLSFHLKERNPHVHSISKSSSHTRLILLCDTVLVKVAPLTQCSSFLARVWPGQPWGRRPIPPGSAGTRAPQGWAKLTSHQTLRFLIRMGLDLYRGMPALPAARTSPSIVPSWRSRRKPILVALPQTAYLQNLAETWKVSILLGPILGKRSIPSHQMTQKIH
jgi:hypothetical protein